MLDELEILRLIEIDEGRLPELLCVDRAPGELKLGDLLLPLFEGAEFLVVRIEELEQQLEVLADVLVDPGSILQFGDDVECVYHREVVEALLVVLEVHEEHSDDAHYLLLVVVVEDLARSLDQVEAVVAEVHQ